ncbi:zinc dependent phospholipase C family protein [Geobacter sp. AOG2]|uniref:zinc dependent phospholipase C family protein n=1 Tax=Geobacter sp. AOG2 TaxID=1566347 RepID=UPI001CC72DD0|nr:zinc dependent phospholipase C family protein [Geobacter sp. AOG2]GFE60496.1 hypothetical protein AOG2_10840 [Geobacter sp. AOG2]
MPGPYAHITLVNELRKNIMKKSVHVPTCEAMSAILDFFAFCELGAVSPDYPNLEADDENAFLWADAMHYTRTGDMIRSGVRYVRSIDNNARCKALAWLLGYSAHVAADVTIHPVVQIKVGDYAENKRQHRLCEMHQDAFVYQRMNQGEIGESNHFSVDVSSCGEQIIRERLDDVIVQLWNAMLEEVHPDLYVSHPPDVQGWYSRFVSLANNGDAADGALFPLAKVIVSRTGLRYPTSGGVDMQYVENLQIPTGFTMHYNDIFDRAIENVSLIWRMIERGVCVDDMSCLSYIREWNLDTGRDDQGKYAFWN